MKKLSRAVSYVLVPPPSAGLLTKPPHLYQPTLFFSLTDAVQTTLLGGGTGPSAGSKATTCTPGQTNIKTMMAATDGIALNFAFTGKGNDSGPAGLVDQIRSGVAGLKVHEVRSGNLVPRDGQTGGRQDFNVRIC